MPYDGCSSVRRTLILTLVLVTVTAACAGNGAASDVRSFAGIAASGPEIVVDPSGTSAVLTVETTIEAICAVSFGIGDPEGRIATDQDMEAAGHRQHRVVLGRLEPDTEYAYRIQGVGVDGFLYRSDVLTFRTPPTGDAASAANIALGTVISEVSSEHSSDFAAANAVDGDLSTEWSSRGDGSEAYITIDLGAETSVAAVAFRTRQMADGSALTTAFTVTDDAGSSHGPFPAGPEPVPVTFMTRYVRFDVAESTGGNTGAAEVEVYGDTASG